MSKRRRQKQQPPPPPASQGPRRRKRQRPNGNGGGGHRASTSRRLPKQPAEFEYMDPSLYENGEFQFQRMAPLPPTQRDTPLLVPAARRDQNRIALLNLGSERLVPMAPRDTQTFALETLPESEQLWKSAPPSDLLYTISTEMHHKYNKLRQKRKDEEEEEERAEPDPVQPETEKKGGGGGAQPSPSANVAASRVGRQPKVRVFSLLDRFSERHGYTTSDATYVADNQRRFDAFYADDPMPVEQEEESGQKAPEDFQIYRELMEQYFKRYSNRETYFEKAGDRVPRETLPILSKQYLDMFRYPPRGGDDDHDGDDDDDTVSYTHERPCLRGTKCIFKRFGGYVGREFLLPSQLEAAIADVASLPPEPGLCIDDLLYTWWLHAMHNVAEQNPSPARLNTFTVLCDENNFDPCEMCEIEINSYPTGIEGYVPKYSAVRLNREWDPTLKQHILKMLHMDFR